jgi:succinoglycan biosynthesis protein ExoA
VWQSSRIRSIYRPRATLSQVFRQYLQYGYWKPFVMKKHGQPASVRHVVPGVFVLLLGIFALLLPLFTWPLVALVGAYVLGVLAMTMAVARSNPLAWPVLWRVPDVIVAYHFGYGIGSLIGWWDALRGGAGRERFAKLTR